MQLVAVDVDLGNGRPASGTGQDQLIDRRRRLDLDKGRRELLTRLRARMPELAVRHAGRDAAIVEWEERGPVVVEWRRDHGDPIGQSIQLDVLHEVRGREDVRLEGVHVARGPYTLSEEEGVAADV